jgi:hypothetical protein
MAYAFFPGYLLGKKRIYFTFLPLVINMFFLSCNEGPKKDSKDQGITNVKSNNAEINFELQPLLKQRAGKTVKVLNDDYFKSSKEYLGYDILPIIDSIIKSKSFDTTNSTIIFECSDGYKPTMPIRKL